MGTLPEYRIIEGSLQDRFMKLRTKIQFYGGGFGNGKTSGTCVKAIQLMKDYPGSHGAILRETLPKVTTTTMKEFFKWLPPTWIKSFNKQERVLTLINGSTCVFSYLAQQGSGSDTTSNVLSATFDWALIDQVEDPGIVYKDFTDLLGRLRGSAKYVGDDPTMPKTGPRWLFLACNPTRNWVYKKLIEPYQYYKRTGIVKPDLIYNTNKNELMIEVVEGSTYENKDNIPEDFIETLEMTYTGQMKDRFLKGEWAGYEGLVYPNFDIGRNVVPHDWIVEYYKELITKYRIEIIQGFDYGIAVPSCYMWGFVDPHGNIFIVDGYYEKEKTIDQIAEGILSIKMNYNLYEEDILGDPAIFNRSIARGTETLSIADIFYQDHGIRMIPAQNDIIAGITKVSGYLNISENHQNPFTKNYNAPYLYVSDKLQFFIDEISNYYWKSDAKGNYDTDKPVDKNDHAMDTLKYMLTFRPNIGTLITQTRRKSSIPLDWYEEKDEYDD